MLINSPWLLADILMIGRLLLLKIAQVTIIQSMCIVHVYLYNIFQKHNNEYLEMNLN